MTKEKFDPYQKVTDQIIAQIEQYLEDQAVGIKDAKFIWEKPWVAAGLPKNASTGRSYNGINVLLIWGRMQEEEWDHPLFLTFNQIRNIGKEFPEETCHVKKGSKAQTVCFWNMVEKQIKREDGSIEEKVTPYLRLYSVFNIDQIECGEKVRERLVKHATKVQFEDERERKKHIDTFFKNVGVKTTHRGERACYNPEKDSITLPKMKSFASTAHYYSTRGHENGHATGHKSRLNRELDTRFGSDAYAFEELVAEFTAAQLMSQFGLTGQLQHAEYIGTWLKRLKEDNGAIFKAASLANQAVKFMNDCQPNEKKEKEAA